MAAPRDNTPAKSFISYCTMPEKHPDSDAHKGAVEEETNEPSSGEQIPNGQLGHRDQDEMLKDADTDFPEPGSSPEHSGENK